MANDNSSVDMNTDAEISTKLRESIEGRKVHFVVLTGGPCAGKTTGQASLSSFFENLGWKVYRVPEAANTLLSGGVKFSELSPHDCHVFQENLLKTMMQIEQTYMALAETCPRNCLVICDRGTMDASAYLVPEEWEKIMQRNHFNAIDIRDNRYNQVIHMVTAANGAEAFYTLANHTCRSEGVGLARELDEKVMKAWIGHPYLEVMDNTTTFDIKMRRLVQSVCARLGIDTGDRLLPNSRKRKFLVRDMQADSAFHEFQDFVVEHDYLITSSHEFEQARLRKRGQNNHWQYLHTVRRLITTGDNKHEHIEQRTQLTERDYFMLLAQRDPNHYRLYKKRRCFIWNNQYFQLDIYTEKNPNKIRGLKILETYTARTEAIPLPEFLDVEVEITADKSYSMYNLSRKEIVDPNIINAHRLEKSKSPLHFTKVELHPGRSISVTTVEPVTTLNGQRDISGTEKHRTQSVVENGTLKAQAHADLLKNLPAAEASKIL